MRRAVAIQDVIDLLNELCDADPHAVRNLVNSRAMCNETIGEHPTVQTEKVDENYYFGLLGVLNGLFGVDNDGYGPIVMLTGDSTEETKFLTREELLKANSCMQDSD